MKKNKKDNIKKCPHGCKIIEIDDKTADEMPLEFYSACDCCDTLMHHNSIKTGYFVMKDGRTLCATCVKTENPNDIDLGEEN
jgi:hypothetical protein